MYSDTVIVVGFAGFCKSDIILYFSRILYVLGEKVAIVDRSTEQQLRFYVPIAPFSEDMLEYRGVDIYLRCKNTPLGDIPKNNYSVVLIDFGINPETYEDLSQISTLFIITDCNKQHTVPLSMWLSSQTVCPASIRIIRDIVSGKIRPRYIDSLLQAGQVTQIIAKYDFPLNEAEYYNRLLTQYDDVFSFTKLSAEFKNMLLDCITEIFKKDRKTAMKGLRRAQIGG
ncbi:MAG TPA: hypothetical protein VFD00_09155 [Thermoclostridium sp.]|nr:hypothetical protein [Thermoclostridium sp.]